MNDTAEKLYNLLPAVYRIRDVEQGEPLKALLSVVAEQVAVLEENLAQIYDDQFIETCTDWVVPYIGDLIGYKTLSNNTLPAVDPRAEVANTIGYRRRKGTAVMLEQLARDVTGWHAHVVEFFQLLATTQYMNHIRPQNRTTLHLGCGIALNSADRPPAWERVERLNTAFDTAAHTVDVRRIASGRGRFNIPNIGIFLWRLNSYPLTEAQPGNPSGDNQRYFFNPLGTNTPLFTLPETLEEFSTLAGRMNVPDPISRRMLNEYLSDYYGTGKSILIKTFDQVQGYQEVPLSQIVVCDLSDTAGGTWAHTPSSGKIAIDPQLGRISFGDSQMQTPLVTFHYGFSTEMGGGEYDRSISVPTDFINSSTWQIGVSKKIQAVTDEIVGSLAEAVQLWNQQPAGSTGVIAIMDSMDYSGDLAGINHIDVPSGSKLLIVGAQWPQVTDSLGGQRRIPGQFNAVGCRPHLRGIINVSGTAGNPNAEMGQIYFNGLLVEGALEILEGLPIQTVLVHCTLVPGRTLTPDNLSQCPQEPSMTVYAASSAVQIDHAITGSLRVDESVSLQIYDTIIDATACCGVAISGLDGYGPCATLHVENSTIVGKVHTREMELASNTIFLAQLALYDAWLAPILADRRQIGCVRFSYLPWNSRVPRRYRCQPQVGEDAFRVMPQFSSLRYGEPSYGQLSQRCPNEIFSGASDESEMGAFHSLFEPQRISNLRIRLKEYLRFGLEVGIFFEPKVMDRVAGFAYPYGYPSDLCANNENESLPGIGAGLI